jgi:hypothetical protein
MAAAVAEAGKTLRLQLAVVVEAGVIPQANRQVLRLPVTADSQLRRGRALTFKALPGVLAPATRTMVISAVAVGAARQMLLLQPRAADLCSAAAAVDRVAERLLSPL